MPSAFPEAGFLVLDGVVPQSGCDQLSIAADSAETQGAGSRTFLVHPACRELARSLKQHPSIRVLLPADAVAVQCTLFDKSSGKNWLVSWHQDLSIPVRARIDSDCCSGWSQKHGQWFVQPAVKVLEQLVAVRVHVDTCAADNGPLKVVPGSHRFGRLTSADARMHRQTNGEVSLTAARGSVVAMRPLILHASSKALSSARRRVLHFVFGPRELPEGLEWATAV
jgi:ectoine hydroxylase-related dioxygenase (phytanoyl-CoA dioxygenase family)